MTEEAGIVDRDGRGLGVVAADLDDDGRVDLFVANDMSANYLFMNQGGFRFEERAHEAGVAANSGGGYQAGMGVACGDLDGDGRPDLAVTNFYGESTSYFRNLGQGLFADQTAASGLKAPSRSLLGFGVAMLDANNDGLLDLLTANGHVLDGRPLFPWKMPLQLLVGGPPGRLTEVSREAGPPFETPHIARGLAAGDLDNDGRIDAVVQCQDEPSVYLRNRSEGGHFLILGLEGTRSNRDGIGATVAVVGSDGRRQRCSGPAAGATSRRRPRSSTSAWARRRRSIGWRCAGRPARSTGSTASPPTRAIGSARGRRNPSPCPVTTPRVGASHKAIGKRGGMILPSPAGEGGRYGRMRVTGSQGPRPRARSWNAKPLIRPFGHLLPRGEGEAPPRRHLVTRTAPIARRERAWHPGPMRGPARLFVSGGPSRGWNTRPGRTTKMGHHANRRDFLKQAALTGAVSPLLRTATAQTARSSPNEKVRFACIGVGGKGESDTRDAGRHGEIVALCDVDDDRLQKMAEKFPDAKKYYDYRKMLEEIGEKIDAVTVSTPDHPTPRPASWPCGWASTASPRSR